MNWYRASPPCGACKAAIFISALHGVRTDEQLVSVNMLDYRLVVPPYSTEVDFHALRKGQVWMIRLVRAVGCWGLLKF